MFYGWLVFHVLTCLALVIVVLMQSSKGEGLAGSAFGGAMSGAVFGGRGVFINIPDQQSTHHQNRIDFVQ